MSNKKKTCRNCHEEIMFTWSSTNNKWILVEPFELDAGERVLLRNRTPIPFDANRHKKHICKTNRDRDYTGVYRG